MAKWIYNNDTVTNTYSGMQIASGAYYEIQPLEEITFGNDSVLLADIGNTKAIVSSSNDVAGHKTDINEAINYLKDNLPKEVKTQKEKGVIVTKMARGEVVLDTNGEGIIDLTVPTGGRHVAGGSAWFETYHKDSYVIVEVHHPIAGKVASYSDDDMPAANEGWWVEQDGVVRVQAMDFFGGLVEGLIMKIKLFHGDGAAASGYKAKINVQWGKVE